MKSEPDVFSLDDLCRTKTTWWDGVRNYQARNFMMNDMKPGDEVLFYHSSCEVPGIAGLATVSESAQPDLTAQDKKSEYFDARSSEEKPIWYCVKVAYKKKFTHFVSLESLRKNPKLKDLLVLKRGQRLSIQPVTAEHFVLINKMSED